MSSQRFSVLVVEDDEALQKFYERFFTHSGYELHAANNGEEALRVLAERSFDAVLLDLMMPKQSGFDVLENLAMRDRTLLRRLIVVTSASRKQIDKVRTAEVFAIVQKPFDVNDLLGKVNACCSQSQRSTRADTR